VKLIKNKTNFQPLTKQQLITETDGIPTGVSFFQMSSPNTTSLSNKFHFTVRNPTLTVTKWTIFGFRKIELSKSLAN